MTLTFKTLLTIACLSAVAMNVSADPNPQMKADAQRINLACQKDAVETGCSGKVVGKGLLKCMHEYKKLHKEYKFSEGCREAMKEMREDRREVRGKK